MVKCEMKKKKKIPQISFWSDDDLLKTDWCYSTADSLLSF